jgi:hypothetical protein
MHPQPFINAIEKDCEILLKRALLNKTLSCFGEDGFGQYGKDSFARYYRVSCITTRAYQDQDEQVFVIARIYLDGYNSTLQGHAATDRNLEISVNNFFAAEYISPNSWTWAEEALQEHNCFTIEINALNFLGY